MVYYVRKNTKLFDDKTFYDYKLCANFVDSQNQVLLDHQRHFRSKFINYKVGLLPHVEYGPNDYRKDASHFTFEIMWTFSEHTLGFCLPEEEPLISNRDQLEKLLEFDFTQKKKMSFFERLGIKQYLPKSEEESKIISELNNLNLINLEKYLSDQTTKLDLFDQANSSWLWKTGRFI